MLGLRRGRRAPAPASTDAGAGTHITLDYPVVPRPRFGNGMPAHPELVALLDSRRDSYVQVLQSVLQFSEQLRRIPATPSNDPREPSWINGWLPQLDAMVLYATLVNENPQTYFEIGSGNSTKFARRAITDHGLRTRIVSVDPSPRAECDELCDEIVRTPFENVDLSLLRELEAGDIVFLDGSHRVFTNSDTTVFFLEVLPRLSERTLVQIHDIFLPHDYAPQWNDRFYNEQYLLACWLLGGGGGYTVHLPAYHVSLTPELHGVLAPLWNDPHFPEADRHGHSFWLRRTGAAAA